MPKPGVTWQWQLTGTLDTSIDAAMYDIDLFTNSAAVIQQLHSKGRIVVCYFSAGSYEPGRSDSAELAGTGLGSVLDGWPDERWVDIRSTAVREVMRRRLDFAVKQGCDGVEPDNVDAYDNANGLGLTKQHQVDFNLFLAREAHARGLSIGLKNALGLVPDLVSAFDWALNEECAKYTECTKLQPFIAAGKAVFHCEYTEDSGPATNTTNTGPIGDPAETPGAAEREDDDEDEVPDDDEEDEVPDDLDDDDEEEEPGDDDEEDEVPDDDEDEEEDEYEAPESYAYADDPRAICASVPAGFSTIIKNLELDAYRISCK